MLSGAGAEVTAQFFDAGHGLTNVELVVAKRWLQPPVTATPPAA
jgi:predicted esterase